MDMHVLSWLNARYSMPLADAGLYKGILIGLVKHTVHPELPGGCLRIQKAKEG